MRIAMGQKGMTEIRKASSIMCCIIALMVFHTIPSWAKDTWDNRAADQLGDKYSIGADEHLMITVHIWGEVRSPGEKQVRDITNLLELISKAGGPTEYADLKKVELTRTHKRSSRFLIIDLREYLHAESYEGSLPVLQPGDIVKVPRNRWYVWRTLVRVASEVAIVANVYYWFTRP